MPGTSPSVLVLPASYEAEGRTVGGGERYAAEYTRALAHRTRARQILISTRVSRPEPADAHTWILPVRPGSPRHWPRFTPSALEFIHDHEVFHLMCFPTPLADVLLFHARAGGRTVVLTDIGGGGTCLSNYLAVLHPRLNPNRLAHGLAHLSRHAGSLFTGWPHPATILYGGARPLFPVHEGRCEGYALVVGRLLPHKGILEVIEALPDGRELRVVGRPYDPAYFDRLRRAAAGRRVTFLTDADDAELGRQYRGANVVLQPSLPTPEAREDRSELLGLVALEAQASGKAVIVTATTSLPELVRDGETGFIVPPGDREALGNRLRHLLSDPGTAQSMGERAARHAGAEFTWDAVALRGLDFYRSLTPPRRG